MNAGHKAVKSRQIFFLETLFTSSSIWKHSMDVKTAALQKSNYLKNGKYIGGKTT